MEKTNGGSFSLRGRETLNRRDFAGFLLASPLAVEVAALGGLFALAPTPACGEDHHPTPENGEGPYFKPESPEKADFIEEGISGERLVLCGKVISTEGTPVGKALLDFWHADANGAYDNEGFRLRGHLYADEEGRFSLQTIIPGAYPGRTRHIHVKVQAPHGPILTTQVYFPDEPKNETDRLFNPELLMKLRKEEGKTEGTFDFVVLL
jgi:protocatechuate 3,4-dioxygenase beta subunit